MELRREAMRGDLGAAVPREMEDLVELREEEREADLAWKWVLGRAGDWYWSQNDSGDSVVRSKELEGVEVLTGDSLAN